jgi:hypothetical protein
LVLPSASADLLLLADDEDGAESHDHHHHHHHGEVPTLLAHADAEDCHPEDGPSSVDRRWDVAAVQMDPSLLHP